MQIDKKLVKTLDLDIFKNLKKYKNIYYIGNKDLLFEKSITVVGSRKATSYGLRVCNDMCSFLGSHNIVTVSGYVAGIDRCVFDTAIKKNFKTIICLGYGFDYIPPFLLRLYKNSKKNLLILSQFKPTQSAKKWTFPARDALLASIGSATVVIEAGMPSGTFYTVKQAFKENKKVFSVPGNLYSAQSLGTNFLIGEGLKNKKAICLYSFNVLLKYLKPNVHSFFTKNNNFKSNFKTKLSTQEQIVLNLLNANLQHFDDLLKKSNLKSTELLVTLASLELQGLIKQESNSMYRLV